MPVSASRGEEGQKADEGHIMEGLKHQAKVVGICSLPSFHTNAIYLI
jgi:hypothetical protein